MKDYKVLELRIPTPLWESFLRLFPNRGERNWILNQTIEILSDWGLDMKKEISERLYSELGGEDNADE